MTNNPPERKLPDPNWEHFSVWETIKSLLLSIPNHFQTDLSIRGVNATEIFSIEPVFSSILITNHRNPQQIEKCMGQR